MSENNDINEFLNKMWSGDMLSLTNSEIYNIIRNMMWQTFLVDVSDISVQTSVGGGNGIVRIEIEGEMFMDAANLINKEIADILLDDEEDDD